MKFLFLFGFLMGIVWWIGAYDIHPYDETAGPYSAAHEVTWLIVTALTVSGLIFIIFYFAAASRAMFATLKLWQILLLTFVTSTISTFQLADWKIEREFQGSGKFWLFYYPILSIATVLLRYFWFRRSDRAGVARP